jgi:fumarylpyruvate hydrolase
MADYVFAPPAQVTVPVGGADKLFPVRRIYCVGRDECITADARVGDGS